MAVLQERRIPSVRIQVIEHLVGQGKHELATSLTESSGALLAPMPRVMSVRM